MAYLTRFNDAALFGTNCIVDAYAIAFFTIAIAAHRQEVKAPRAEIARAALRRWPTVLVVYVAIQLVIISSLPWIFGTADEMMYGLGVLPTLIVFGMISIATVIACLDTSRPWYAQPGFAFFRSVMFAWSWANVWRMMVGGAFIVVPVMLQWLIAQYLARHGMSTAQNNFWSDVPIDALVLGPTQAFFTYLYMDLMARER